MSTLTDLQDQSEYISDHKDRGTARFTSQFSEAENLQALRGVFSDEVQVAEDVLRDLFALRTIATATGETLDLHGAEVGELRGGRNDADYRVRILLRIVINRSSGTPPELLTILKGLTEADFVRYLPNYPAAYEMITDGDVYDGIAEDIEAVAPAGVGYASIVATYGTTPLAFLVESGGDQEGGWFAELSCLLEDHEGNLILDHDGNSIACTIWDETGLDTTGAGRLTELYTTEDS